MYNSRFEKKTFKKVDPLTKEEFETHEPYQYLIDHYYGSPVALAFAVKKMAENAKAVKFSVFTKRSPDNWSGDL